MSRSRGLVRALVLTLALATSGCQPARLHAKDLLYHSNAAVRIPSWSIFWLIVAPLTVAWLPVSLPVLGLVQGEPAVWFALAPGIIAGGPVLFLIGTPIRWIAGPSEPPASDEKPASPPGSQPTDKKPG